MGRRDVVPSCLCCPALAAAQSRLDLCTNECGQMGMEDLEVHVLGGWQNYGVDFLHVRVPDQNRG